MYISGVYGPGKAGREEGRERSRAVNEKLNLAISHFTKGAFITVEGRQKADSFFIVQSGSVKLSHEALIRDDCAQTLGRGDFLGVVSAMAALSQIETSLAVTDAALVVVPSRQLEALIRNNGEFATKILTQLSARLRFLDDEFARLALKDSAKEADDGPARLFEVAEYCVRERRYDEAFYAYSQYLRRYPRGPRASLARDGLKALESRADDLMARREKDELIREYRKGEMVFAEGEPGDELFVLHSGSVRLSKIIDDREIFLGAVKPGDIFGEMAILNDRPRAASALASEDSKLMAVKKTNMDFLIQTQPQLIAKLISLIATRIWSAYKQMRLSQIADPLGRVYGALLIQLEKSHVGFDSTASHVFSASWEDVVKTLGFSEKKGYIILGEIAKDSNLRIDRGVIEAFSVKELVGTCRIHEKIDARKRGQLEAPNRGRG